MPIGNVRTYGVAPFKVAVLHGGPGAPGYMAPVARELSSSYGVLEPIQTAMSFKGQAEELCEQLSAYESRDLTLVGSSWGAVLALFVAELQRLPLRKLILVGSAVFDAESSAAVKEQRLARMCSVSRRRFEEICTSLESAVGNDRDRLFAQMASLLDETDFYDPISTDLEVIEIQEELHRLVWSDFQRYRDNPGYLEKEFRRIGLPVVIIHGAYDPHPQQGIEPVLTKCCEDVTTHVLPRCGHYPWLERQARDEFYVILRREIEDFDD